VAFDFYSQKEKMMSELNFALYGTQSQFIESISPLLNEFEEKYQTSIKTTEMSLDDAWGQLFNYTIHGGGPDLARIGTIWTSSLISLNALRPFKSEEVTKFGGADEFFKPIWQSGIMPGDTKVWAIPFTAFNYVLFYRKDILEKSGIDEGNAFATAEAMRETLRSLKASGVQSPWIIPTSEHYRARLHILASWIWGADGHFISEDGKQVLLNQPKALQGLKDFYELHRFLSPSDYGLTTNECRRRFARGQAAIFIGGPDTLQFLRELNPAPGVVENLGVAALPGVPWIGGSSLVVWKDVLANPVMERNINNLIAFLTEKTTQIRMYELSRVTPARSDALLELELDPPELLQVEKYIMETGRSYRRYSIWIRIQNDLVNVLDQITAVYLNDTSADVVPITRKYVDPFAKRYNLILSAM
jgi:ABC-type glycerol-3-phosphate transport system substrate-binding protein